jgi:Putative auto-transporter adhesin, head GIN domain
MLKSNKKAQNLFLKMKPVDLKVIYSKTDRNISSNGVVTFDNLQFVAFDKDADGEDGAGTGDFIFEVNNSKLNIDANSLARFYIKGQTDDGSFNIYNGDGRLDASNLAVQRLTIFHRGSNDMIVRPIEFVTGKLVSTGDVVLKNNPPLNTLVALYQGSILYP